jgi:hypothetical protein
VLLALVAPGIGYGAPADEPAGRPARLVALPVVDLSGGNADRARVDALLVERARNVGFDVVATDEVLEFLRRERLRYTGGVASETLDRLRAELGADAVLVASVDAYEPGPPPRMAIGARILTASDGRIASVADVALSGDDHVGVLGLGEIGSIEELADLAAKRTVESLARDGLARADALARAPRTWSVPVERKRHRPKRVFHEAWPAGLPERVPRVAVLPFENRSARPEAGEVLAGLFATWLAGREGLELIEPGVVREALLRGRVIQEQGLSLAQGDALRELLDVDLVVTGRLLDYADFVGAPVPRAAFSVWVIDVRRRVVVWSAYSANRGDDGVAFFDVGRVRSARALASGMVLAAATRLARDLVAPAEAR